MRVTAALSRALSPDRLPRSVRNAVATAHFARALRSGDPFEQCEEYFKAVEYFVPFGPPGKKGTRKQLEGDPFDQWVSDQTKGPAFFTPERVRALREMRNRVTHSQATLGHLSPSELQHVEEVKRNIEDLNRLATILIWGTPTPWQ